MKLITAPWQNRKSFRLLPVTADCPYVEGIYDPDSKILVLLSAIRKETFHMATKLDENGDVVKTKFPRPNGKTYKEERKTLETFTEYYIQEKEEIEEMIKEIAVNAKTFDFGKYMTEQKVIVPEPTSTIIQ